MAKKERKWGKIELSFLSQESATKKNKSTRELKRSYSQQEINVVDLTLDDDEHVAKRPKLAERAVKDIKEFLVPKTSQELAVHPKKVNELRGWFEECERIKINRPNLMLLVTGPCGSAKLTAVKVIAEEQGFEVFEYSAPFDYEMDSYLDDGTEKVNQRDHLLKFLLSTSRYTSIYGEAPKKRCLIVKEFPNYFIEAPEKFAELLGDYQKSGKSPLIFITNDTKGKQINFNFHLFPDSTVVKFGFGQISINPVANKAMKKVLKSAIDKMTEFGSIYTQPTNDVVDSIVLSSQGDLRNAIINLLFTCMRGQKKMQTEEKQIKSSKTAAKVKKFKRLGADETITFLHALGKVFYPKYEAIEGIEKLTNNPEALADLFITQANTFVKMIFTNYVCRFKNFDEIVNNSDMLSVIDVITNEYREQDLKYYGLALAIRSTMVNNTETVAGWGSVKGYKNLFNKKPRDALKFSVKSASSICDYESYMKIIGQTKALDLEEDEVYNFE